MFISIFLTVCFIGNLYIFRRLFSLWGIKRNLLCYLSAVILTLLYPASMVLGATFPNPLTMLLGTISATWLGIGLLLISVLLVFEVVNIFAKPTGRTAAKVILTITALLSVYSMINARIISIETVVIPADFDMTIAHLSDIHTDSVERGFLRRVVEKTNSLQPDVVLITGDMLDSHRNTGPDSVAALNDIKSQTFFVTGNHERYAGIERVMDILKTTKVQPLRNQAVNFENVRIIGIDDSSDSGKVRNELARMDISPGRFNILMYHRPVGFEDAAKAGVDLMLAGHTHNGQIFPFNYFVRCYFRYMKGLFRQGSSYLYVSTGTGTWGPRMRLGSRSQIVLIKLHKEESNLKSEP